MNCREFERTWNGLLDDPGAPAPVGRDARLEAHERTCAGCRALGDGYRAILRAIQEPPPAVAVPADFAGRILAAVAAAPAGEPRAFSLGPRWLVPLATAAALVAAVTLGLRGPVPPPAAPPEVVSIDPGDLTAALTEVGFASLTLAREASAPAARVGGEVIGVAGLPERGGAIGLKVPGVTAGGTSLLSGVGERVNAGVRPLSGTARSAFGFLVGVTSGG